MPDAVKLTEFVENYLLLYGIDKDDYRVEIGEDGEWYSVIFPDGMISEDDVSHMLLMTGLTREELFGMEKETMDKYYGMFPFFALDNEFQRQYQIESQFSNVDRITDNFRIGNTDRYDVKDLKKRILRETMELDEMLPGTYHKNAIPVGLCYSTEWLISFPKYKKLIISLLRLIDRYKELFIRTIKSELTDDEIREMNFLAHALDVHDRVLQDILLHYDNVVRLRNIYRTEKLHDFFSYVIIGRMEKTKYWRCEEFLDDDKLLHAYINAYPEAFSGISQYLMRTKNFSCWFYWSDNMPDDLKKFEPAKKEQKEIDAGINENAEEKYIVSLDDDEYDEYLRIRDSTDETEDYDEYPLILYEQEEQIETIAESDDFLGITYLTPDEEFSDSEDEKLIHLYIAKKPEELFYNVPYFDRLREIIKPKGKNGLPYPKRECASNELMLDDGRLFDRKSERLQAMAGGA